MDNGNDFLKSTVFVKPPNIRIDSSYVKNTYFNKGDTVKVERLPNAPIMLVEEIVFDKDDEGNYSLDDKGNRILKGVKCGWFSSAAVYLTHVWNTKDLIIMRLADKKTYDL